MACPTESDYGDDCDDGGDDYSQDFECPQVFQSTLVDEDKDYCGCSDDFCACNEDTDFDEDSTESEDTSSESSESTESECLQMNEGCNGYPAPFQIYEDPPPNAPFNIYQDSEEGYDEECEDQNNPQPAPFQIYEDPPPNAPFNIYQDSEEDDGECAYGDSGDESQYETAEDSSTYETGEEDNCTCG